MSFSDALMDLEVLERSARAFVFQFAAEVGGCCPVTRFKEIEREIEETGTYTHTFAELEFGAKLAWRNSNKCIGRLFWNSLTVFDHRSITHPDDIFQKTQEYLRFATNGGKIRSSICIFPPKHPSQEQHYRFWNPKLIRYAGYETEHGIIGDPEEVEFTRECQKLGWSGKGSSFDILPVVIQTPDGSLHLYEHCPDDTLEVRFEHPKFAWFADLGLRWYAVPIISNMILEIGGIHYTAAPFNGWFMGTEIGSRNLGDVNRYNLLPLIAEKMGLDTRDKSLLWKDRALIELNTAVLFSYKKAGVTMVDHHTASHQFMRFAEHEKSAGRAVTGDWSWLVPPVSGSACEVFHHKWKDEHRSPNFLYSKVGWKKGD